LPGIGTRLRAEGRLPCEWGWTPPTPSPNTYELPAIDMPADISSVRSPGPITQASMVNQDIDVGGVPMGPVLPLGSRGSRSGWITSGESTTYTAPQVRLGSLENQVLILTPGILEKSAAALFATQLRSSAKVTGESVRSQASIKTYTRAPGV